MNWLERWVYGLGREDNTAEELIIRLNRRPWLMAAVGMLIGWFVMPYANRATWLLAGPLSIFFFSGAGGQMSNEYVYLASIPISAIQMGAGLIILFLMVKLAIQLAMGGQARFLAQAKELIVSGVPKGATLNVMTGGIMWFFFFVFLADSLRGFSNAAGTLYTVLEKRGFVGFSWENVSLLIHDYPGHFFATVVYYLGVVLLKLELSRAIIRRLVGGGFFGEEPPRSRFWPSGIMFPVVLYFVYSILNQGVTWYGNDYSEGNLGDYLGWVIVAARTSLVGPAIGCMLAYYNHLWLLRFGSGGRNSCQVGSVSDGDTFGAVRWKLLGVDGLYYLSLFAVAYSSISGNADLFNGFYGIPVYIWLWSSSSIIACSVLYREMGCLIIAGYNGPSKGSLTATMKAWAWRTFWNLLWLAIMTITVCTLLIFYHWLFIMITMFAIGGWSAVLITYSAVSLVSCRLPSIAHRDIGVVLVDKAD